MSDNSQMLTKAFCFENQSIEPAEQAHAHRGDHFFCPHEGCLKPVTPAQSSKDNYFFKAYKHRLHQTSCPYYKEPTEHTGSGAKSYPAADPSSPLIPTVLGDLKTNRTTWRAPSYDELLIMVRAAYSKPPLVYGSLEQVVSEWERMPLEHRSRYPLHIGDEKLNYESAFVFLGNNAVTIDKLPWSKRILYGGATLRTGNNKDYVFIKSLKRFDEGKPLQASIHRHLSISEATSTVLFNSQPPKCTLFWLGERPTLFSSKSFSYFKLNTDHMTKFSGIEVRQRM